MSRALALSAYVRLLDGGRAAPSPPPPLRGQVSPLWVHIADPSLAEALGPLSSRLTEALGEPVDLITTGIGLPGSDPAPEETSLACNAFFDRTRPVAGLWLGLDLRPVLALTASRRAIPQIMAASDENRTEGRRKHLLSGAILDLYRSLLALTPQGAMALRRLSPGTRRVDLIGPLETTAPSPEADEDEISRLHDLTQVRPVWIARPVTAAEAPLVIEAHRMAVAQSHRLLLIAVPADAAATQALIAAAAGTGLTLSQEAAGQDPEPRTQVYLPEDDERPETWYRLASIAYLGDTLTPEGAGASPEPATSLGSALISGPSAGPWLARIERLIQIGAARRVTSARALGEAVIELLAPDKAAAMAHAAWSEGSAGAPGTDRLSELLADIIEENA